MESVQGIQPRLPAGGRPLLYRLEGNGPAGLSSWVDSAPESCQVANSACTCEAVWGSLVCGAGSAVSPLQLLDVEYSTDASHSSSRAVSFLYTRFGGRGRDTM